MQTTSDWRQSLSFEDQQRFDSLLYRIQKYRHVYENSEFPQFSQMWLAVLELEKDLRDFLQMHGVVIEETPRMHVAHAVHATPVAMDEEEVHFEVKKQKPKFQVEHPEHADEVQRKIDEKQRLKAQGKRPETSEWVKQIEENW